MYVIIEEICSPRALNNVDLRCEFERERERDKKERERGVLSKLTKYHVQQLWKSIQHTIFKQNLEQSIST